MGQTAATSRMYLEIGNPTVNDDESNNYEQGNFWFNNVTGARFWATSVLPGAAEWARVVFQGDSVAFNQIEFSGALFANVTTPEAYPYNVIGSDYCILASSAAANTINLPVSSSTGRVLIIKDATGSAGNNPITINGNGNTIDGQASINIPNNYGFATLIFNGNGWSVI